ncbi:hypothetical protein [Methylobacterium indicum]|uniref:Uncharacterized protein n=1 Tax=Methylobacterium indicum TaxID=1775910 RepID=A0A8H9CAV8_9HYPH|nr:hypothetical protein [Methylobacterium indicum]BCM87845.1 hypothetical protein mvi_63060 [Methylobacterium indicum]
MRKTSEQDLVQLELRAAAADKMFSAKVEEFMAHLFTSPPQDRECARINAISAFEAVLDMHETLARIRLRNMGIDPERRHAS